MVMVWPGIHSIYLFCWVRLSMRFVNCSRDTGLGGSIAPPSNELSDSHGLSILRRSILLLFRISIAFSQLNGCGAWITSERNRKRQKNKSVTIVKQLNEKWQNTLECAQCTHALAVAHCTIDHSDRILRPCHLWMCKCLWLNRTIDIYISLPHIHTHTAASLCSDTDVCRKNKIHYQIKFKRFSSIVYFVRSFIPTYAHNTHWHTHIFSSSSSPLSTFTFTPKLFSLPCTLCTATHWAPLNTKYLSK